MSSCDLVVTDSSVSKIYTYGKSDRAPCHIITEIYAINRVKHPNICEYKNISVKDGKVEITMPKYRPIERISSSHLIELISALAHLESLGIVHGDIDIYNIMQKEDGSPVIIDFDVCFYKRLEHPTHKLLFRSPEETGMKSFSDCKSDLYALAISVLLLDNKRYLKEYGLHNRRMHSSDIASCLSARKDGDINILKMMLKSHSQRLTATQLLADIGINSNLTENQCPIPSDYMAYLKCQKNLPVDDEDYMYIVCSFYNRYKITSYDHGNCMIILEHLSHKI